MSENRFSAMLSKFSFRKKDKKFVSISFRNTYRAFFVCLFLFVLFFVCVSVGAILTSN